MTWDAGPDPYPPPRRRRRTLGPAAAGLLVVLGLLGGALVFSPGDEWQTLRRLAGLQTRMAEAPVQDAQGPHSFMMTQRGSEEPVGYDPCRPIRYQINPDGAPASYERYVDTSVARVSAATGLVFEYVGTTDSRAFLDDRPANRRTPVLVGWADEEEVPDLEDEVAGIAGSIAASWSGGRYEYVTGSVVLDVDAFDVPDYEERLQAVVDHEFGHLVGLGHVDDPSQLMHASTTRRSRFAGGDLEGLQRLGNLPCR